MMRKLVLILAAAYFAGVISWGIIYDVRSGHIPLLKELLGVACAAGFILLFAGILVFTPVGSHHRHLTWLERLLVRMFTYPDA